MTVVEPGLLTTVQDKGRWGYQSFGMPVAGVMDRYALAAANLLAGNPEDAAVLEMTLQGGVFRFDGDSRAAVCGADMGAELDGRKIPNWSCVDIPAGGVLRFGFAAEGCRAYLAPAGGIDVPLIQGSRSTFLKAGIGGFGGRALRAGDELGTGPAGHCAERVLPAQFVPRYGPDIVLRVLPGPQDDYFTPAGLETFFSESYRIANEADRMGYRLEGPPVAHKGAADIVSDALCQGAVQIPGHGRPIVMMADRQTCGGYAKIGTVIGPDLRLLAQGKPGDRVRFVRVGVEQAEAALYEERATYGLIRAALGGMKT